jgi:acyl-CoA reductase-like NAD-dependent aldehyde dehydrogenase
MPAADVRAAVARARAAALRWRASTFAQRRRLMRVLLRYVVEHQEEICRVSAADSGKPLVDAAFGELIVTCEKLAWLASAGEGVLKPEARAAGRMQFYKRARVEWEPLGVVGAIVPFNYPFHNLLNPISAAIFAGNACVVKASEHASWSARVYAGALDAALRAAGAPAGLVQVVTGGGEAGRALVAAGVDKLIFVGSTGVGRAVMRAAADTLTPVVLELGGKDAFVLLEDADLGAAVPTALRGAFQACGHNCLGAERFLVHERLAPEFIRQAAAAVGAMRQGAASDDPVGNLDQGAIALPGLEVRLQELVDDAVARGATLVAGGAAPPPAPGGGRFYPPTILANVTSDMRVWKEEVFGPIMTVATFKTDDEAAALANDCAFGLGLSVWSRSTGRALALGRRVRSGMLTVNDFAATYMAQSLPFGGVKESGFDRFAGVEGLRGMALPRAVALDRWPFSTAIPPLLRYPVQPAAFGFVTSLVWMFYAPTWGGVVKGLGGVIGAVLPGAGKRAATRAARGAGEKKRQ